MYFQACFEQGRIAEDSFMTIAKNRKWNVIRSSNKENRYDKWDFLIQKDDDCEDLVHENNDADCRGLRVDVKSMKKIQRTDNTPQDYWVWIELHGCAKNKEGWLYDSKAHVLAFETINSFLLIDRKKLVEFVEKNVDLEKVSTNARQAFYQVYIRKKHDRLTLVEMNRLRKFSIAEWKKPTYMVSSSSLNCRHIRTSLHDGHIRELETITEEYKSSRLRTKRLREITETIIEYTYCPLCGTKFTEGDQNHREDMIVKYQKF